MNHTISLVGTHNWQVGDRVLVTLPEYGSEPQLYQVIYVDPSHVSLRQETS